MNHLQQIGEKIRELRSKNGITQEKLSELADIDISFISLIESGKNNMSIQTLEKIASALKTDIYNLIKFESELVKPNKKELLAIINEKLISLNYQSLELIYSILKDYKPEN